MTSNSHYFVKAGGHSSFNSHNGLGTSSQPTPQGHHHSANSTDCKVELAANCIMSFANLARHPYRSFINFHGIIDSLYHIIFQILLCHRLIISWVLWYNNFLGIFWYTIWHPRARGSVCWGGALALMIQAGLWWAGGQGAGHWIGRRCGRQALTMNAYCDFPSQRAEGPPHVDLTGKMNLNLNGPARLGPGSPLQVRRDPFLRLRRVARRPGPPL